LEDNLMRIFASDRVGAIMQRLGMQEGEAIEHPWVSRAIENAQRKVEGHNFDMRKQLLEYDDVANDQRKVIYGQRNEILAAEEVSDTVEAIRELTSRGAHVSIDALGHPETCYNSVANLRKRGKHIQVGLMTGDHASPTVPMSQVVANELEIYGSHGIQAFRYDAVWEMIRAGRVRPTQLVGKTISLEQAVPALMTMDRYDNQGITIIDPSLT
jgi:D-arabinose 1-dehydrogenase-like Zn-dependent alcohol dehydrogenase